MASRRRNNGGRPDSVAGGSSGGGAASSSTTTSTGGETMTTTAATASILLLASTEDHDSLSPSFCLIREQIEIFAAAAEDVEARRRRGGQKDPISKGRVGLRCIHCRHVPHNQRTRGAVMYPNKMALIYQATRNFQRYHLMTCPHIPSEVIDRWGGMKRQHASNNSENYWVISAEAKGIMDTTIPPKKKKGSSRRGVTKLSAPESGMEFRPGFDWTKLCVPFPSPPEADAGPPRDQKMQRRGSHDDVSAQNESAESSGDRHASHPSVRANSTQDGNPLSSLHIHSEGEEGMGDALDQFLDAIDQSHSVNPNNSSAHHSVVASIGYHSASTGASSTTTPNYYSATMGNSSENPETAADFEPTPLSTTNHATSNSARHYTMGSSSNHQQFGAYDQANWANNPHSSSVMAPSAAAAPEAFQPPAAVAAHHSSVSTAPNDQSEALLADAIDNIARQRELLDELARHS